MNPTNNHNDNYAPPRPGDFSFMSSNKMWPKSLSNAYQAITRLNLWDFMKTEVPPTDCGYMFWRHPNLNQISEAIADDGHSGASFACCMRNMELIAKRGWDNYVTIQMRA